MAIISKKTGERIDDREIIVVNDSSGKKKIIIRGTQKGFEILNHHSLQDFVPSTQFVGGDISMPYLRVKRRLGINDTFYPVSEK